MITNLPLLLLDRARHRGSLALGVLDDQIPLGEALGIAARGSQTLTDRGLNGGDRVALVARSSTEYLLCWMSCLLAGIPVALINPTYPHELLGQMLDHLDPALVVTDLDTRAFAGSRPVLMVSAFRSLPQGDPLRCAGLEVDRLATASYMHTSGTTGAPKFCAQSHEYFLRLGRAISEALGLRESDRMLAPLPLFHINPLGYGIVGALTAGCDALAARKFSASGFWPDVHAHGITALSLHAPPIAVLKRATSADDARGHRVRTMFYADGEFMRQFGVRTAVSGYGSTEAAGISHLHQWSLDDVIPPDASRHGGQSRRDVEWRLSDAGEILIRETEAGTLFSGYLAQGKLTPSRDEQGWFWTGDLGRIEEGHGLVFLERAAESIRARGEFVPIPFVEERLSRITELTDFALWKKPGDLGDDDIVLYVVADSVPVEQITSVSTSLPSFMRPRFVAKVPGIPRDAAAGKVQRRLLPDQEVLEWVTLR